MAIPSPSYYSIVYGLAQKLVVTVKDRNFEDKSFLVRIYQMRDGTPLPEMLEISGTDIETVYANPDTAIHIPITEEQSKNWELGRDLIISMTVSNDDDTIAARGTFNAKVVL